jgi:hypothetical protein
MEGNIPGLEPRLITQRHKIFFVAVRVADPMEKNPRISPDRD